VNKLLAAVAALVTCVALWLALRAQTFARVDAAGPTLRVLSVGAGEPTVIFEAGAGSPLEAWTRVQPEVSKFTRTFSYDRAGNGMSTRSALPRDGRNIAAELHAALQSARVPPPYILVGHSLGGPCIRVFAGMYPNEVAGMVLVDPTQEELIEWAKARDPKASGEHQFRPDDEVDCAPLTFAQAQASQMPVGVPIVLISGLGPRLPPEFLPSTLKEESRKDREIYYPVKLRFHRDWVDAIPGARLIVTEDSGHGIPLEEPDLVVRAIRDVVIQSRGGTNSAAH
jgi:pimeloyl-ACP methyl ester carboxylesterase